MHFNKDNKKEKPRKNIFSRKRTKNENVQKQTKTHKTFSFFGQIQRESTKHAQNLQICENVQRKKVKKQNI